MFIKAGASDDVFLSIFTVYYEINEFYSSFTAKVSSNSSNDKKFENLFIGFAVLCGVLILALVIIVAIMYKKRNVAPSSVGNSEFTKSRFSLFLLFRLTLSELSLRLHSNTFLSTRVQFSFAYEY